MERSADHPFATGCCQLMLPAARRPSTVGETTVWASGSMALLPNAAGEVPHEEEAARSPQARCCRVQRSTSAALVWTASAVAESVTVDRRPMRTLGMLFVLSGRVRELSARCPEDVPGVARSRARCLSGSGQLTRAAGCMWCAFQEQSRRLTRMVSVAVATPRGDPCGGVPRGKKDP